jgi:hypothetical protein
MMKLRKSVFRALLALVLTATNLYADQITVDQSDPEREGRPPSIIVPFAFSTEALETGLGAVFFRKAVFQPQDGFFLTGYGTSNSSFGLFGGMTNLRLSKRLFFSPTVGFMDNDQQRFYGDFGYELGGTPPSGSNESDQDDFVFGGGIDSYLHLTFRYVLPIGAGKGSQPHRYTTNEGVLAEGSTHLGHWNPATSGRTFVVLRPFYQRRTLDVTDENVDLFPPIFPAQPGEEVDFSTNGIMLGIEYDNTDFVTNPSRGSMTKFDVHRDFGAFDSLNSWTSLDFSFAKYWSLGDSKAFAQRVLAANVWAAYSPTWDAELVAPDVVAISNRPPGNRGATLGGVERQRGYPRGRFNDKAAINYTVELRLIPHWDPFRNWPIIRKWPWRWWQVVGFAEFGRVAPSWNFGDLHEDMKWTAGAGIRAMIGGGIIRFDFAASDEASQIWVMARQAF